MTGFWVAAGATCCAVSVIAGAFGAHGLKNHLGPDELALWETSARYLMYGGLGIVLVGLLGLQNASRGIDWAAGFLFAGSLVFSGTVAFLALGGPRWLGAITPLGGLAMIIGFVTFAVTAFRL